MKHDPDPQIAVVIATRDREDYLAAALEALASQSIAPQSFEVVVVRDEGEPGPTRPDPDGLRVRHLFHHDPAPAAKRNLGWRTTDAPLIAFTDDDCRPERDWLERLATAARVLGDSALVQGRTLSDPHHSDLRGPLSKTREVHGPAGLYETCNVAYSRTVLERVGGFDETFRRAWGEDVDLGWRARNAGAAFAFEPDAVVYHAVLNPGPGALLRAALSAGDAVRVVRDYPELRGLLYMRLFWRRSHPWAYLGVLAVALGSVARRPAGALALVPWSLHHLRRGDLPGGPPSPRELGVLLALDLAGIAAMVRGSVRYRSPML